MAFKKITPEIRSGFSEQELLFNYRVSGDLELLGLLYEPYMSLIYGLCLKYLKDEAKSEDAVMQIFEQLIGKLRIHEVSHFKSWLYTLARNHCLMELRSADKHPHISIEETFVEFEHFEHPAITGDPLEEKLTIMEQCVQQLNADQQQCIRLFYLEEKCYKEVAEITGFDLNKVKSCIQNGKRNLKICMDKFGNGS
ncbi:RNA polymerase sigma-70 factor, ECF subfamily [bacterium A37T11]|nr:RNA polymerase sigma-70 factor, ECF subfamily [bacterium A37T11]